MNCKTLFVSWKNKWGAHPHRAYQDLGSILLKSPKRLGAYIRRAHLSEILFRMDISELECKTFLNRSAGLAPDIKRKRMYLDMM